MKKTLANVDDRLGRGKKKFSHLLNFIKKEKYLSTMLKYDKDTRSKQKDREQY